METPANYDTGDDAPAKVRDARTERRFFVDNVIIRGYGPIIGVYGIAVYNALCVHANKDTQQGYPSHRKIADLLDCSVAKVKESIKFLDKLDLIRITPRYDEKTQRRTSNLYTLMDPPAPPAFTEALGTTDTLPTYREKATNNPPLDQSYLNKEPPTADSPPASFYDDPPSCMETKEPPQPRPLEPVILIRQEDEPDVPFVAFGEDSEETAALFKDPPPREPRTAEEHKAGIRRALEKHERNGGRAGVSDPTKAVDPWRDKPVQAWCAFIHLPYAEQSPGRLGMLANDLRAIATAEGMDKTPDDVYEAIKAMAKSASCEWMRSAGRPTHKEFTNVLTNVLCGQVLPEGKRNGGSSGGRITEPEPQPAFTFAEPDWLGATI